jgi:hypothetical protein
MNNLFLSSTMVLTLATVTLASTRLDRLPQ